MLKSQLTSFTVFLGVCVCFAAVVGGTDDEPAKYSYSYYRQDWRSKIKQQTFKVVTIHYPPYVYEDNGNFRGYIPDVLDVVCGYLNTSCELHLVKDGQFGSPYLTEDAQIRWNGMVGEILSEEADIIAAPIRETGERLNFLAFTKPFDKDGYTAVFLQRPDRSEREIKSLYELLNDDRHEFIAVEESETHNDFLRALFTRLESEDRLRYVDSNEDGYRSLRDSGNHYLIFITAKSSSEFEILQEPCDLHMLPLKELGSFGYGLAFDNRTPVIDHFTLAMLEAVEAGEIYMLQLKWWYKNSECPKY